MHQDYIYDYRDYSSLFSPILNSPKNILPYKVITTDADNNPTENTLQGDKQSVGKLNNGNILLGANYNGPYYKIIDSLGETVVPLTYALDEQINVDFKFFALKEGGFVLVYAKNEEDHVALKFKIFSNSGGVIAQSTSTALINPVAFDVSSSGNDFFIASYEHNTPKIKISHFSNLGVPQDSFELDSDIVDSKLLVKKLSNNNYLAFYQGTGDYGPTINARFYSSTGQLISNKILAIDYIGGASQSICISPNNNIFVQYENGGPDASSYVLFNQEGEVIAGPRHQTSHEPYGIGCGTFGNNYAALVSDDESIVVSMRIIKSDGSLYPHDVIVSSPVIPSTGYQHLKTLSVSEKEMIIFYTSYSGIGYFFHRISPGMLELKATSENTVRLYNYGAVSVPATVSVFGSK